MSSILNQLQLVMILYSQYLCFTRKHVRMFWEIIDVIEHKHRTKGYHGRQADQHLGLFSPTKHEFAEHK